MQDTMRSRSCSAKRSLSDVIVGKKSFVSDEEHTQLVLEEEYPNTGPMSMGECSQT